MIFEFGDYAPDLSPVVQGKSPNALNVIPVVDGYVPFPSFVTSGVAAINGRCLGAIAVKDVNGVTRIYMASATKIYEVSGLTVVDRTRVAGNYAVVGSEKWEFTVGVANALIAVTIVEPVQSITLGGANFGPLITSTRKPKARHCTISNLDWLTLANVTDAVEGDRPTRVWWSKRGTYADFDPNLTNQCGLRDLDLQYGPIISVHSREFTTVIQETAIHRMTFEGGTTIFRFDLVETNTGQIVSGAITHFGPNTFYLSTNGFMVFNGNQSIPIGSGLVDRHILDRLSYDNLHGASAAVYAKYQLVVWGLPTTGAPNISILMIYSWSAKKWAKVLINLEILFNAYSLGVDTDDVNYSDLDTDTAPQKDWIIDNLIYAGGLPGFSAVNTDHVYCTASGSPLPSTIETSFISLSNRQVIDTIIPIVDACINPELYVYTKDNVADINETVFGPFTRNLFGEFVPIVHGRTFRFGITMDDFLKAVGLEVSLMSSEGR